jgi:hypothetical protein
MLSLRLESIPRVLEKMLVAAPHIAVNFHAVLVDGEAPFHFLDDPFGPRIAFPNQINVHFWEWLGDHGTITINTPLNIRPRFNPIVVFAGRSGQVSPFVGSDASFDVVEGI